MVQRRINGAPHPAALEIATTIETVLTEKFDAVVARQDIEGPAKRSELQRLSRAVDWIGNLKAAKPPAGSSPEDAAPVKSAKK